MIGIITNEALRLYIPRDALLLPGSVESMVPESQYKIIPLLLASIMAYFLTNPSWLPATTTYENGHVMQAGDDF